MICVLAAIAVAVVEGDGKGHFDGGDRLQVAMVSWGHGWQSVATMSDNGCMVNGVPIMGRCWTRPKVGPDPRSKILQPLSSAPNLALIQPTWCQPSGFRLGPNAI